MDMNPVDGLRAHKEEERNKVIQKPSREEAEAAVRTLIAWAGDNPDREGLLDTPGRVTRAYEEFFAGYQEDPSRSLAAPSRRSRATTTW